MIRARERKVELHQGTSFGFDTTRVTVAATGGGVHTAPFFRISAGVESLEATKEVAEVILAGIRDVLG
jgi:hypothetical protein